MNHLSINGQVEGFVQVTVVDANTREIVRCYPEQRNLILNQGMDNVAAMKWYDLIKYCALGTGTTVTKDLSGASTASQSGTTVTLVGVVYLFTLGAADQNNWIKWDSGQEARILSVTDTTHAEVSPSQTVGSGPFTVFRTNQTGLTTEVKRTGTLMAGTGNTAQTINSPAAGQVTNQITFEFAAETGAATYTEIAFSHLATAGANANVRIRLDTDVVLAIGQQAQVRYRQIVTCSPSTPTVVADPGFVDGWLTAGGSLQWQNAALSGPSITLDYMEPSVDDKTIWLTSDASAHASFGTAGPNRGVVGGSKIMLKAAYVSLSFLQDWTVHFSRTEANAVNYRSLFVRSTAGGADQGLCFLFNSAQGKNAFQALNLTLRQTWSRVLA